MGMVVPFPKPDRSWRASLLIFLVDCWSKKSASSSGSRGTVSSSIWALSRLLDLLSLRLPLAHLAQSIALQSSLYKDMQNSQVLSREQTPKQALILQVWQWVWLSPSPSLNGPDEGSLLIFLVDCWSKKIITGPERHCILVHLGSLPTSGLALLAFLIGTPRPIHGPPIVFLQRYAKFTSVVMRTNSQTSLDPTVLAISMVVPFPKPEWSWRASLLIFLVDCWSKKSYHHQARETLYSCPPGPSPDFWTCSPCDSHWHISAKPWPSNPRPAKICKTAKCCHEKKHPNKPWLYSFGNEYGCPLPGGIGNSPDTATAP